MNKLISIPGLSLATSSGRRKIIRDNNLDVLTAEVWAREALYALPGNLVLGNVAYRDYSDEVSTFGSVVNVARPGSFNARRKTALCEAVKIQDGNADSFQLTLDQYLYVTFKICDGEENRPLVDLISTLLVPAVQALSSKMDLIVAGQHVRFWNNAAGHLEGVSSATIMDYLVDTNEVMMLNKVPFGTQRDMVITPRTLSSMLKTDLLVSANRSGTTNTLRNGEVGRAMGFDFLTSQSEPSVSRNNQLAVTALVNAGQLTAGSTTITYDGEANGPFTVGQWVVIAGDDIPHRILSITDASNAGTFTINPGLKRDIADNAAIRAVKPGLVNKSTGYSGPTANPRRLGYSGYFLSDGWSTTIPQVGQPVSFGSNPEIYTIIEVSTTDDSGNVLASGSFQLQLDRPLEVSVADNATINLGPAGQYNLALTKNALALAIRPLPKPRVGALSSVVSDPTQALSIRVTITYDGIQQAHIVTLDLLAGVGMYDNATAAVMFG